MGKYNEIKLDDIYITSREFCDRMGWSTLRNLYFAIKANRIRGAIKVGRTWIIPASAVAIDYRKCRKLSDKYINKHKDDK